MATATLTPEQRQAVECRDVSVALSAGAGCGKTHVLTERFLSHLGPEGPRPPARLGQLIAITFTDAAAREMRSRIRSACYERLRAATGDTEQHHWLRLLREIDQARISTIHAFCAALLRTHAAAAGLDPTFAVLDQGAAEVLQSEVIDDVMRERLAELDGDALDLAAAYGLGRLKQQIAALLHRRHEPVFEKWLHATPHDVLARWHHWAEHHAFPNALREIAEEAPIDAMLHLLRDVDAAGRSAKFQEAQAALLELLPRLKQGNITRDELQTIRNYARVQGLCSAKDWPDGYAPYRDACKEVRDVIDKRKPLSFDADAARPAADLGFALLRLTDRVCRTYEDRKAAQGKLDFDDLLSRAYELVRSPKSEALRRQLSEDLCLLLVDEFQDTDQLQAELVKALCGPGYNHGPLFFVGDFKQSIYRFRGAEPKVFHELRASIPPEGQLPLTTNFRSQPAILDFVNALFRDAFHRDGDQYQALRPCRPQATEPPAVEFLWSIAPNKNNRQEPGALLAARRQEARAIAFRLRALLDPASTERPVVDAETQKPRRLKPGDVTILFRALSDVQVYEEALREHELEYYLVGGHAFYAQQEIYDVLHLLRAVASTADEVSLAGVLRSPFFALLDETLFWLAETAGSLNAGLLAERLPSQLSAEERTKAAAAAATIRHLRSIKDRVPIATLLGAALDRTGYDAVLLTEFLGQRKLANLHKLLERARAAQQSGLELDEFIMQLSQFIAQQPQEALAATLPEAADVIRLMTIHHAKGLEFPLVIVPDLDRGSAFRAPPAALHRELGPLVPLPGDDEERTTCTGMSLFVAAERAEELEERQRLLYVACTRAADYLILSSSLEAYEKPKSDWMKLLAQRFDLKSGDLITELPRDYGAPHVRVTQPLGREDRPAVGSRGPDLLKMLEDAHALAGAATALVPPAVAPIPADHAARRQFSVSRLSGQLLTADGILLEVPSAHGANGAEALQGSALAPQQLAASPESLGLGTLVHDVLARIDFARPQEIAGWCEHLAPSHVPLNPAAAAATARELIERFLASSQGGQLAAADALYRELEFLLAVPGDPAASTRGAAPARGASYIRGYIDCLYQDAAGAWRVADFKTNNIAAGEVARTAARYELQLYVYALAAERVLGEAPAELVLHFLRPGVCHVFAWNASARNRAQNLIRAAVERARNGA